MPPAEARALRAAGASDVGRQRSNNEDRFHVDTARGIFMVVDGIGGQAAGETAADTAIAVMTERLTRQTGAVADRVREAITIANNEILRLAATRADWHGMACVLTVAVVEGSRVVVGHVGDSRLYRIVGSRIEKLTPDHSPVGEREDARELTEIEAMRHPRRHEVFRDVGSEAHEITDPDFVFVAEHELPAGASLLLCSDGLTDLVTSDTIRQVAAAHAGSPEAVVQALLGEANRAGGKDNVTAVFVERPGPTADTLVGGARRSQALWWLLIAAAGVAGLAVGTYWRSGPWPFPVVADVIPSSARTLTVAAGKSIAEAIGRAESGTTVLVDSGTYNERLVLREGVRVMSRVPRGAVLRLPPGDSELEPAVVAAGLADAELNGFRIVGDAATPLGTGVVARDSSLRLVDIEVTGASSAAIDLGAGVGTMLLGGDIHHNSGPALVLRTGATARVANSTFSQNALAGPADAAFVVDAGAMATWTHNVFVGLTPAAIGGLDAAGRATVTADNWFITPPPAGAAPRREGRPR